MHGSSAFAGLGDAHKYYSNEAVCYIEDTRSKHPNIMKVLDSRLKNMNSIKRLMSAASGGNSRDQMVLMDRLRDVDIGVLIAFLPYISVQR